MIDYLIIGSALVRKIERYARSSNDNIVRERKKTTERYLRRHLQNLLGKLELTIIIRSSIIL
jgi:hypothetical protein